MNFYDAETETKIGTVSMREGWRRQRPKRRSGAEARRDYSREPDPRGEWTQNKLEAHSPRGARHNYSKKNTSHLEGVSDSLFRIIYRLRGSQSLYPCE